VCVGWGGFACVQVRGDIYRKDNVKKLENAFTS
jgi:hypothetical protein